MIALEDRAFEKEIFETGSDIAVPFVLRQTADGETEITVYSFCRKIAEEFEKKFESELFSDEAKEWLDERIAPLMSAKGYSTAGACGHTMMRFCVPEDGIDVSSVSDECELISTLEGESWDELELDDFVLDADEPSDRMAVIRREGRIVCYCALNDISEEGEIEINVECEEKYRNRGFGKSCVAMLADYLAKLGETVSYVCSVNNEYSAKTARSAGLVLKETIMPYVCYIKEDDEDGDSN